MIRLAALLLASSLVMPASAQTGLLLFPANQYGRASLTMPQTASGLSTIQLQNVLGRNANFERLDNYRPQDRFRRIALPVGRLDLLVSGPMGTGVGNCTASILSERYIVTNSHCFPAGQGAVRQASLLMDFYSEDAEAVARRFEVRSVPVERDAELDYAIAEVLGNPSATFGRVALEPRDPEPGESLLVVHHPMGMPKHMTRGGCRAHAPVAIQGTDIRHRCDTLPGSSGSPILSEASGRMIGLHYGGSPNPGPNTWNSGKRLTEIAARSTILAAAITEQRRHEDDSSRSAAAVGAEAARQRQDAAMRAEIERRVKEQVEAELRARAAALRAPAVSGPAVPVPAPVLPPSAAQPPVSSYPAPTPRMPAGATFQDCPECPAMVVVPASPIRSTMEWSAARGPGSVVVQNVSTRLASGRDVAIPTAFAVGKFEVTFEEWDACFAAGGCAYRPDDRGWGRGRLPVVHVNWEDAQRYVAWLSRRTGKDYRLLSEAEWEYVAQAGTGQEAAAAPGKGEANCKGCARRLDMVQRWDAEQPVKVGGFAPNGFGLHDMLGNAREWTGDCWNETHAGTALDAMARTTGDCTRRVIRGGSWDSSPANTGSARRDWSTTVDRSGDTGFRVARGL